MRSVRPYQLFVRAYADMAFQMRRLADLVIAAALLAVALPLMLLVALAIKWEGPGPIFERQTRIGRGGRRFELLEFRTRAPDPQVWTRKTTQVGEFLRYTRIDRLPQLLNVLRGEISVVDPEGNSPSLFD
jgi:lipopolysaccharide/colanic/teichoic acid biosynthesis glycosyltransferase